MEYGPELEVYNPIDSDLRDVAEIEDPVCSTSYTQQEDTCDSEECGAKVGFLSGLRDGGMEGYKGCILIR